MGVTNSNFWQSRWLKGVVFIACVVGVLSGAVYVLTSGRLYYKNYWGGRVFAPLAVVLILFVIAIMLVKWRTLNGPKSKLKGKAARRAQRAALDREDPARSNWRPW